MCKRFDVHSSLSANGCNSLLKGKSFYWSPETRKFFQSRVVEARTTVDGLAIYGIESFAIGPFPNSYDNRFPNARNRAFRAFAISIDGRSFRSNDCKNSKEARKYIGEILEMAIERSKEVENGK